MGGGSAALGLCSRGDVGDAKLRRGALHKRPGEQECVYSHLTGDLSFALKGVIVVEKDEVSAAVPGHVGKIAGAQFGGEEDAGAELVDPLGQRVPGQRGTAAGGCGQTEILCHHVQCHRHTARAELGTGVGKPLQQRAAGQGRGDHNAGTGREAGIALRDVQVLVGILETVVEQGGQALQRRKRAVKIQNDAGPVARPEFLKQFAKQTIRRGHAIEPPVVKVHQTAAGDRGPTGAQKAAALSDAVGQMGGCDIPGAKGMKVLRRHRDQKGILRHHVLPLVQSG